MRQPLISPAALAVPVTRAHRGLLSRAARSLGASGVIWAICVLNFSSLRVVMSDERVQFTFVQRMFGDAHSAVGYYFGLALVEAPLYGVGKLLDTAGLHVVSGHPVEQTAVALGLGLLTLAAWPLLRPVLAGLSLPHPGFAVLAAALGTPFFYYATFVPTKTHALDGVLFAGAIYLTYRYFRTSAPERWLPIGLGILFGLSYTVRYFDGAEAVVLVLLLLWWRRFRHAVELAATSAVVCLLLFVVPCAVGVKVFAGGNFSAENVLTFAPLNPLRMLFTDHRGYFVWSPVAALAVVGFVHLFRRRPEQRRFLVAVVGMSIGVIASYSLIGFWDGTFAFGQRFYTPLFPAVAMGVGGLVDLAPRIGSAAASLATAWTLFLCFNLVTIGGPQYLNTTSGGASDLGLLPHRTHTSVGAYAFGIWHKSNFLQPFVAWPFGRG